MGQIDRYGDLETDTLVANRAEVMAAHAALGRIGGRFSTETCDMRLRLACELENLERELRTRGIIH